MLLPEGITGFGYCKLVDADALLKRVKSSIYSVRGEVDSVKLPGVATNFYRFHVRLKKYHGWKELQLLLNGAYPWLAAAHKGVESQIGFTFCEIPSELKAVLLDDFVLCSKEMLVMSITSDLLSALSESEMKQIRYWKPQTIGEVVFNHFD